eukprot:10681255-Heterocapsa_arctica.AAC.1
MNFPSIGLAGPGAPPGIGRAGHPTSHVSFEKTAYNAGVKKTGAQCASVPCTGGGLGAVLGARSDTSLQ